MKPLPPPAPAGSIRDAVVALWREGLSCAAIGRRLGISANAAWNHVAQARNERIIAMHRAGVALKAIYAEVGCSKATVGFVLADARKAGETLPARRVGPRPLTPALLDAVARLRASGLTYDAVARELGVDRNRVSEVIRALKKRGHVVPAPPAQDDAAAQDMDLAERRPQPVTVTRGGQAVARFHSVADYLASLEGGGHA